MALTAGNVVDYVRTALAGTSPLPLTLTAELTAHEIPDGNLNFAFCVCEAADATRAIFVKQVCELSGPDVSHVAGEYALHAFVLVWPAS